MTSNFQKQTLPMQTTLRYAGATARLPRSHRNFQLTEANSGSLRAEFRLVRRSPNTLIKVTNQGNQGGWTPPKAATASKKHLPFAGRRIERQLLGCRH